MYLVELYIHAPFTFMAYAMIIQKEGNRVPDRVMFDTSQGRFGPF
jgi:hypothetical protein